MAAIPLVPCRLLLLAVATPLAFSSLMTPETLADWKQRQHQQTEAVTQLAVRLLKQDAARFAFVVSPDSQLPTLRAVIANTGANSVRIEANSGVAAAWALHYYLTNYCSAMVTWSAAQVALPPSQLPLVPGRLLNLTAQDAYTMMPNVVTFSYSYAWWGFADWERHIDWMALHGVNLAYALTGQERVFRNVYLRLGLTDAELDAFFPGPAFLAWGRMGNIKAWGGPLPPRWYDSQADLQRRILHRMTSLGMAPVLQGFSGIVPDAFVRKFPHVNYTRLSDWNNFGANYSEVVIIDPSDPMFLNISAAVITENVRLFGQVTHHYAMDPFNENIPSQGDPDYITAVSAAIFKGFVQTDPMGIWVLQSWFLSNAADFWTPARARAFFDAIDKNHLLVIDLWGEMTDSPQKFDGFYGHKFAWTALHNFGGNTAMYGRLELLNSHGPFELRRQFPGRMVGTGIQPEGIGQNEVVYEYVMQFNWRSNPAELGPWVRDYARRRYGRQDENMQAAWTLLLSSVYSSPVFGVPTPALVARPSLTLSENADYNTTAAEAAWKLLITTNQTDNALLNYDQVDLTRQMLQIRFYQYYSVLTAAAKELNATGIETAGQMLLRILDSMNELLQADEHFLLQKLINQAKSHAAKPSELALYEFNVRNQLTCWGPGPYTIEDYAARMYNGLIAHYYRPRWDLFVQQLGDAVRQKVPFNQTQFELDVFVTVELPFYTGNSTTGPAEPTGLQYNAVKKVEQTLPPVPAGFSTLMKESRGDDESDALPFLWLIND